MSNKHAQVSVNSVCVLINVYVNEIKSICDCVSIKLLDSYGLFLQDLHDLLKHKSGMGLQCWERNLSGFVESDEKVLGLGLERHFFVLAFLGEKSL